MMFICCGSHLMIPHHSLTYGDVIELTDAEGQELALANKALVPADHIDFEFDGSDECIAQLAKAYAEYRSLLSQALETETEKET